MSAAWATVIAATVTGSFGVIVALIHKFRKENRADHGQVMSVLGTITSILHVHSRQLESVDEKVATLRDDLNTHSH